LLKIKYFAAFIVLIQWCDYQLNINMWGRSVFLGVSHVHILSVPKFKTFDDTGMKEYHNTYGLWRCSVFLGRSHVPVPRGRGPKIM